MTYWIEALVNTERDFVSRNIFLSRSMFQLVCLANSIINITLHKNIAAVDSGIQNKTKCCMPFPIF